MQPQEKIGLIGLGLVGMAICKRLLQAGYQVHGHDLRPESASAFQAAGGLWHGALCELADCSVLIMAVFQTADVENVMQIILEQRQKERMSTPQLVVDCSTGEPVRLQALAEKLSHHGIDFLEAPLSGSSQQIAAGQATMLLGGASDLIAACAVLIRSISPKHINCGGVGMGAKAKLATNLVLGLNRAALAEGMAFAQSQGIAPAQFLEMVLDSPARSDAALVKGAKMVSGDFSPQSRIRQHLKDLDVMLTVARTADQGLPLTERHAQLLRDSIAAGDGDLDNAAVLRQMQREKPKE